LSKFQSQNPQWKSLAEKKNTKCLGFLIRIVGTILIISFIIQNVDIDKVRIQLALTEWLWVLLAILISIITPMLGSIRLKLFLAATGIELSYKHCLKATFCSLSLNLVLPARGGDFAKLALLKKDFPNLSLQTLISTTLLERGFDILTLGLIGLTSALIIPVTEAAIFSGLVATFAAIGLTVLPLGKCLPLVGKKINPVVQAISKAYQNKKNLFLAFITAASFWMLVSSIMGCLLKAFDPNNTFVHAFAVTPPSIFAGLVPVSLWGVGTRDGTLAYFLQEITAPEVAISAGFLYTVLVYWLLGLIGTPFLLFAKMKNQ
jgi:uncharacterized membrane protein YbhN (UPF0104 family)